ncbi:queuosine precursor transporter [Parahaliea sp. F7430]|uniref:Probable queuosine precursor transporter n=1 Tax=Sediminihaliea albiluteola TaxID=2758564 RepID=A0A7W2TVR9_9GAMM|nr:queuosine precursor transporter [Sediminihaliea albiluteola]MBA6412798.1 queuosine precursor transporter [Sediminihaliea albiluteola]
MSAVLQERRERVFLILAGTFLAAMTLLNVIGITRFIHIGPMALAVGVLPYPLTFLCTDLICELYGKARANFLVSVGLGLNFLILLVLFLGGAIPAVAPEQMPPWQVLQLAEPVALPNGDIVEGSVEFYQLIYATTSGAVFASMLAYITAQYCDVQLFHFWKRVTKGKYLWVRNNFSTLMSQMVDSVMVITVTFGAAFLRGDIAFKAMLVLIGSNYLFKATVALLDTGPFYLAVHYLRRYLHLGPSEYAIPNDTERTPSTATA